MAAELIVTNEIAGQDLTGKTFGRWTVIRWAGLSKNGGQPYWACHCSCSGKKADKNVYAYSLLLGKSVSCGCRMKEVNSTHGMSRGVKKHPLYRRRIDMCSRCDNPNNAMYENYGGRGITYDPRWSKFEPFLEDVLPAWEEGKKLYGDKVELTMDRQDNDGNYEKSNVRFVPNKIQANNTRRNARFFSPKRNETHTIAEWSDITGLAYANLEYRLNDTDRPVDDALDLPVGEFFKTRN